MESPIFEMVTNDENISKLIELAPDKYTQYWDNKEKKARKLLNKNYVDFGQYFIQEFHEFIPVNVIETETEEKNRNSMMIIRNHTMSSIRKRKEGSVFDEFSLSAEGNESALENPVSLIEKETASPFRKTEKPKDSEEAEAQSGIVS